jgi:hypothetical protein
LSTFYDIFNGDADGICALQQLRLEEPRASVLVTGAKRDIALVGRIEPARGDELTVLDISFAVNAPAVRRALEAGARCRYFDHHHAGEVPRHPNLRTFIDTAPDVCTSLLVDRYLSGRQRVWAVVAAFGDNMAEAARRAARPLQLPPAELERLRELGECINYNAYGETIDDLHYHPADLYQTLSRYRHPREFIEGEPVFEVLRNACQDDLCRAETVAPALAEAGCALYVLPDAAWSRRVSGHFVNRLAQQYPGRAHAVAVARGDTYTVSVRAAAMNPRGADELCLKFDGGGGRKGAAGINRLPAADLDRFIEEFRTAYAV